MSELISDLQIEGFRALADLRVSNLGHVNLVTGKNNSGKSSLLEAIRLLATGASLRTMYSILNYREEMTNDAEKTYTPSDLAPFCSLFSGLPDIASSAHGFTLTASGTIPPSLSKIHVSIGWFLPKLDAERNFMGYESATADMFDEVEGVPALDLDIGGRKRIVPLERVRLRSAYVRTDPEANSVPCVYLDPFSSRSTRELGALWDAIALTDVESEVVSALKIISSDIQAVSMIGSDDRSPRERTAIARSRKFPSPVPLRTFGDGVNRLFGIILSLCNARNGILLVDEIENGLHYSVQSEIWRIIFRLARDLKVQVFATSHSWDCVRAFQEAASESADRGVLIRLTKVDESVTPTLFSEDELQIATRDQVEVR